MTPMGMAPERITILGGAGKTGARIAARLMAMGVSPRLASRATLPRFDWHAPDTWDGALADTDLAYVAYHPDLAVPRAAGDIARLAAVAARRGVARIVLLSGRGEPGAQASEAALQQSGVAWTILRASWFSQNFSEGYLGDAIVAGELALPAGDIPEPFVDADDIADAAVAALTQDGHAGKIYELTGSRALTFREAVAEIAHGTGRPIGYREISHATFDGVLGDQGVPDEIRELLGELFTTVLDGRNVRPMDGVHQLLRRPPTDFTDFVRNAAATGVWQQAS